MGFSNGGMMSYSLACLGADFIAAVGIMSGISISGDCETPNISTSIIHFHSTEDNILPYEGNRAYQARGLFYMGQPCVFQQPLCHIQELH